MARIAASAVADTSPHGLRAIRPSSAPSEAAKQALLQEDASPFFTTSHFDGHLSVLLRESRIGELTLAELTETVQAAWLARAWPSRAAAWLRAHATG